MILNGERDRLTLGNLDALRDWGHAKDYVKGMWMMLQADKPDDFVLSTGEFHTVREFVTQSFKELEINIIWEGKNEKEVGKDSKTGKILVKVDPKYYRPTEVELLLGDPTKAKEKLHWQPKVKFKELVKIMVKSDLENVKKKGY